VRSDAGAVMMTGAAAMGVGIVRGPLLRGVTRQAMVIPLPCPEAGPMVQALAGAVSYPAMIAMVSLFAGVAILPPHDR